MRSNVYHSSCACNAQIQRTGGQWQSAEYSTFSISDEAGKYQLSVSGYSGDAGNAMARSNPAVWNANGMKFSTPDQDNDLNNQVHRGSVCGCGWWFEDLSSSHITDDYNARWSETYVGTDVEFTRMLVRAN